MVHTGDRADSFPAAMENRNQSESSIIEGALSYLIFVCIYLILNLMYFLFSIATGITWCGGMRMFGMWHENLFATTTNT
jgi:hypothetical protein